MGELLPMPRQSEVFTDVRGGERSMRVSVHPARDGGGGTVVVSLWLGPLCRGSFRLAPGDLDRLLGALSALSEAVAAVRPVATSVTEPARTPSRRSPAFGFGPAEPDAVTEPQAVTEPEAVA